jgi:hypothetical protein
MALRGPAADPDLQAAFEHLAQACESLARVATRRVGAGSTDLVEALRPYRKLTAKEAAPLVGQAPSYLTRHARRLTYAEFVSPKKPRFLAHRIAAYLRGELPEFNDEEGTTR